MKYERIMMGQGAKQWGMVSPNEAATATMGIFIYLDDVDAHYARAQGAGAEIVHPPRDESYGRTYTARDLDGHPWFSLRLPPNTDRTERNGDRCDNHSNRPSCFALHESTAGT